MYYIKNGLGKGWMWLAYLYAIFGVLTVFGTGNATQVNTITASINTALASFGLLPGNAVTIVKWIIGVSIAIILMLVLLGGIKRIGRVTERLVPFMAVVYIICSLCVVVTNAGALGKVFAMIFKGAFSAKAALGGAFGITMMKTIQKGVGRGVFSNEAGLGSAPIAHAASSESDPVKQGMFGIFEVFMDTIVICTLTALTLLCGVEAGVGVAWGESAGAELISASFGTIFGNQAGALIVAVCLSLFALTTILSWSLYGTRCCEYLIGTKLTLIFQVTFVVVLVFGAALKLELAWNIADTLNGFMAIPNLIALLGLSGVVIKLTKEHFEKEKLSK